MSYVLAIGDRSYSSWSLRGWLLFARFGLPVTVVSARLYSPDVARVLAGFGGARTVPALRVDAPAGFAVWDSLAIAETLADRHPEAGLWPADPAARGLARALAAEMHSGFSALRDACPMNLRRCYAGFVPDAAVLADLARIEALWAMARAARRRRSLALRRLFDRRRLLRAGGGPDRRIRPPGRAGGRRLRRRPPRRSVLPRLARRRPRRALCPGALRPRPTGAALAGPPALNAPRPSRPSLGRGVLQRGMRSSVAERRDRQAGPPPYKAPRAAVFRRTLPRSRRTTAGVHAHFALSREVYFQVYLSETPAKRRIMAGQAAADRSMNSGAETSLVSLRGFSVDEIGIGGVSGDLRTGGGHRA